MRPSMIPYVGFSVMGGGLIGSFLVAYFYGHFESTSVVPFVSEIGLRAPGAGLLAMVMNWYCFTTIVQGYIFYRYVVLVRGDSITNTLALCACIVQSIGGSVAGCFGLRASYVIHQFGAFFGFGGGLVYCLFTIGIFNKLPILCTETCRKQLCFIRWSSIVLQCIFGYIFTRGAMFDNISTHPVTTAEWIALYSYLVYVLTISHELTNIRSVDLSLIIFPKLSNGKHERND